MTKAGPKIMGIRRKVAIPMTYLSSEINGVVRKVGDPHDQSRARKSWGKSEKWTIPMTHASSGINGVVRKADNPPEKARAGVHGEKSKSGQPP